MTSRSWLFLLSCIALITSAFTFSIRGEILQEMGNHFGFKQEYNGLIDGARFWGMAASLFIGGFICDAIGMKNVLWLAFLSHMGGTLGMVYAPTFGGDVDKSLDWLWAFSFIMGCGNGFTETAINPLVATLYPREKTHYLNILHAWWPGGLIIGGLLALFVGRGLDLDLGLVHLNMQGQGFVWWQSLLLIAVPACIYGLMLLPARFPPTERVASGVSTSSMFAEVFRPLFILWGFCMLLTASTELGPQNWQSSVMEKTAGLNGTQILIYTSGMMFILRHFAGPIAHQISPVGLLLVSAILSSIGLYLLSFANNVSTAFGYATIFGLGIAYFWPTMLGVASERFPKGGAMILCLLGTIGNAAIAYTIPQMGQIVDHYSVAKATELETDRASVAPILKQDDSQKFTAVDPNGVRMVQLRRVIDMTSEEISQGVAQGTLTAAEAETLLVAGKLSAEDARKLPQDRAPTEARAKLLASLSGASVEDLRQHLSKGDINASQIETLFLAGKLTADQLTEVSVAAEIDQVQKDRLVEIAGLDASRITSLANISSQAQSHGFSMAFRWVSVLPTILVVIFGLIWIYDWSRGGYKAEHLLTEKQEAELLSGGSEGQVL